MPVSCFKRSVNAFAIAVDDGTSAAGVDSQRLAWRVAAVRISVGSSSSILLSPVFSSRRSYGVLAGVAEIVELHPAKIRINTSARMAVDRFDMKLLSALTAWSLAFFANIALCLMKYPD
jgi:hypothetical protein